MSRLATSFDVQSFGIPMGESYLRSAQGMRRLGSAQVVPTGALTLQSGPDPTLSKQEPNRAVHDPISRPRRAPESHRPGPRPPTARAPSRRGPGGHPRDRARRAAHLPPGRRRHHPGRHLRHAGDQP
ncbi:hypothetical protein FRAHR75_520057 [Frankia sp. Hr75.2]|nr:hypothetical protein FRAHR75_520057 [Frankia sp. Hr75.2]